jgi:hypothetical protein
LALKFEELIRSGTVSNYGDGTQVVRVSRSRVTQMTGLLNLAPDIQEEILFLATAEARQPRISEPSGVAALESTTRGMEESAPFRSLVKSSRRSRSKLDQPGGKERNQQQSAFSIPC